jgi:hypothetical protein
MVPGEARSTVVRTDRRLAFLASAAVLAAGGVTVEVLRTLGAKATSTPIIVALIPASSMLMAFVLAVFARGGLSRVSFSDSAVEMACADGTSRRVPVAEVGALGMAGLVVRGHTVDVPMSTVLGVPALRPAVLVVYARNGAVVLARRAGWFRVDQLSAAAGAYGIAWQGCQQRLPSPADLTVPARRPNPQPIAGGPGLQDAATVRALADARSVTRGILLGGLAVLSAGPLLIALMLYRRSGTPVHVGVTVVVVSMVIAMVVVASSPLRSRTWRTARRTLKGAPWEPVEIVVLRGSPRDATGRSIVVLHGANGLRETWAVRGGGERGWLQPLDRGWFLIAVDSSGRHAALAPTDRRFIADLERLAAPNAAAWARDAFNNPTVIPMGMARSRRL